MELATRIAAAKALLRERRERLNDYESQAAEVPAEEVRRLEAEVFRLTRFLIAQGVTERL